MKVTVVGGGGNVGSTVALAFAQKNIANEIILVDLKQEAGEKNFYPSIARGLDQWQSAPIHSFDTYINGTTDYKETQGTDVAIITAGIPRRPGMSRDDLLEINAKIVNDVVQSLVFHSPDCILIVVSNPLDVMSYVALKASGLPSSRVIGMAGILDTARFRSFLAHQLNVSPRDIQTLILGGHGDTMVPLPRYTTVSGIPITQLMDHSTLNKIIERTKYGGGEIVSLMGTSAWYAPGAAAAEMAESILLNQHRIHPCCAYLNGEYGLNGIYIGVPVKLGKVGIEQIIEIELNEEEQNLFDASAGHVKKTLSDFHMSKTKG